MLPDIMSPIAEFNNSHLSGMDIALGEDDLGYLEGSVKLDAYAENKILISGTPKQRIGAIPFEFITKLTATMLQFSPANYIRAVGSDSAYLETYDGVTDYYTKYWTDTLSGQQLITLKKEIFSNLISARFAHKRIVSATDVPVINDTTGDPLSKTADYFIDYTNGRIYARPGGAAATDGYQVRAKYKALPRKGTYLPLKPGALLSGIFEVTGTATDPSSGKTFIVYYPKAEITPSGKLSMAADNFWSQGVEIAPVHDYSNPTYPLGYLKIAA